MVTKEDLIYRQVFTLKDGARILLRPLTQDDRQALIDLFAPVSAEDLRYMRHNVKDNQVICQWVDGLDYTKVFPLVAVFGSRIVGLAILASQPRTITPPCGSPCISSQGFPASWCGQPITARFNRIGKTA